MRDRLIKILREPIPVIKGYDTIGVSRMSIVDAEKYADRLLANGVIVPPCKVGVKVYFAGVESGGCLDGALVSYCLDAAHLWFNCHYTCGLNYWHPIEDFGTKVFLTREEAERALKGGEGG